jgi:UDP-N-acetylglucosamine:LPS N-acetylglucosamine transferase
VPDRVAVLLREFTREKLIAMARAAREAGKPDATGAVARACMELAHAA